jgi:glycosyltransferase involved in cell wall biosynthesis
MSTYSHGGFENAERHGPLVSVVIPTRERRSLVLDALAALGEQTLETARFEVLVVTDGSNDGTFEAVNALEVSYNLRCEWQPHRGRAAACNAGARLARGELLVFLDDDMRPLPDCLRAHVGGHPTGSRNCMMGAVPAEVPEDAPAVARYMARKFDRHLDRLAVSDGALIIRDFYTGNASIRREVFLELGGFDEEFREYGNEDLELAVRLLENEVRITYSAAAAAFQRYAKTFAQLAEDTLAKGRTAVLVAKKHPTAVSELRLGTFGMGSRSWRVVRRLLLHVPAPTALRVLVVLTSGLDASSISRTTLYYRLAFDYLYWLGVRQAAARRADEKWRGDTRSSLPLHSRRSEEPARRQ